MGNTTQGAMYTACVTLVSMIVADVCRHVCVCVFTFSGVANAQNVADNNGSV